jgi:hypothetical protein
MAVKGHEEADLGLLALENTLKVTDHARVHGAALDAHDRSAHLAAWTGGEGDHPVDALVGTLLLGPALRLGADEIQCPPLDWY